MFALPIVVIAAHRRLWVAAADARPAKRRLFIVDRASAAHSPCAFLVHCYRRAECRLVIAAVFVVLFLELAIIPWPEPQSV